MTFGDGFRDSTASVDATVIRSMVGHVSARMTEHYSSVGMDEKRLAMAKVVKLVPAGVSGAESTNDGTNSASTPTRVAEPKSAKASG